MKCILIQLSLFVVSFFDSILQDMKRKITKVKDYHGTLMETLSDMLAEHFPLPGQQAVGTKKKKVPYHSLTLYH